MARTVSQHFGDAPNPPDDTALREAVTLAAVAALIAWLLDPAHDPTLAAQVFVIVAGGLRPMR